MNRYIEKFILENEDLIEAGDWDTLYAKLWSLYGKSTVSDFTETMSEAGIFPIYDLTKLPESYRFNSLNIDIEIIPDNIIEIGPSAYEWCVNLTEVKFNTTKLTRIGENAFQFCTGLKEIEIPNSVKHIDQSAFSASKLEKLILNEGIEIIDSRAFLGTNLTEVIIPRSVYAILPNAFPPKCILKIYRNSDAENIIKYSRYKYEYID